MASITIRIDDDIKKDAEVLFTKLGFSLSGAINVFFRQAVRDQAIPFQIKAQEDDYFNEYNMKHLAESIAQLKAGNVIIKTIEELEAMENE